MNLVEISVGVVTVVVAVVVGVIKDTFLFRGGEQTNSGLLFNLCFLAFPGDFVCRLHFLHYRNS